MTEYKKPLYGNIYYFYTIISEKLIIPSMKNMYANKKKEKKSTPL